MNFKQWSKDARMLADYKDTIDVGLHFNLTEGTSLAGRKIFNSLGQLILMAYSFQLNKELIKEELKAQIYFFYEHIGCMPNFIDGHQHIQQLPVIRDALIEVYNELDLKKSNTYIRASSNGLLNSFSQQAPIKNMALSVLGGLSFKKLLKQNKILRNTTFSGAYNFDDSKAYEKFFASFLKKSQTNGIIMCHPGFLGKGHDPIRQARYDEYSFLMGEGFEDYLLENNVKLGRFLSC